MRAVEPTFEVILDNIPVIVTEAAIGNRRVFHCQYSDERKALTLTVGIDLKDKKFWTSVPEGRQDEAEKVGKLIAAFIKSKKA
ncbi:hypothetical protein [Mucilaginibacter sp. CSA2-8R]|uniref:hypothetical protein n=1 Tax=Mucilaginibacter sp. CSA2-8R TaxID=3141542 RepID=UPI00315D243D